MSVCPLRLVFSFTFNQAACLLHPTKPYQGINFLYQHFISAAYLNATELCQRWISETLQSQRYYKSTLVRYLQLNDWDLVRDRFGPCPSNKDVGGLIVIDYGDPTS